MSARHPTPWTVINCNNGARGKWFCEWGNIVDDNGIFVADGIDLAMAREIAEAVNGRAALRSLVRRLAETLNDTVKLTPYDAIARDLLREAREAIGEGAE